MTRRFALWTTLAASSLAFAAFSTSADDKKPASVLVFTVDDIDGKPVELSKYKGDVLLIVNTASKCGYTPQYEGLESLLKKYEGKGLRVLAFPANEFGKQEPGTNPQIKEFCTKNYGVTFPVFSKIVVKGKGIHPLYQFLTDKKTDPKFAGPIPWNFTKFLVDRQGNVIARFEPNVTPESDELVKAVETSLAASAR